MSNCSKTIKYDVAALTACERERGVKNEFPKLDRQKEKFKG
jgi:hypothetical protein